jgi:hypothetical protein
LSRTTGNLLADCPGAQHGMQTPVVLGHVHPYAGIVGEELVITCSLLVSSYAHWYRRC